MALQIVAYGGWKNNVRLSNGQVELIVTLDVGPRVIRYGFVGGPNAFGELPSQMGAAGESHWMIRGGHRFWMAPESKATYEPDNVPVKWEEIEGGVRVMQPAGTLSGVAKLMDIQLKADGRVHIAHKLKNELHVPVYVAPWALTVMPENGECILPLPRKITPADSLLPNQSWAVWGYTDMTDPGFVPGRKYLRFRQRSDRGKPFKLGVVHSLNWAAYWRNGLLFAKWFDREADATYPDFNVNFECYFDRNILEVETLGPLETLLPGLSLIHDETWAIWNNVPESKTEDDLDRNIKALVEKK